MRVPRAFKRLLFRQSDSNLPIAEELRNKMLGKSGFMEMLYVPTNKQKILRNNNMDMEVCTTG